MNELQQPADKIAISLSALCAIHCLVTPLLITLLPAIVNLPLESETLHMWMVVGVFPTSLYALTLGCKKHRNSSVAIVGGLGLVLMVTAIVSSTLGFGEAVEKVLTMLGTTFIAIAHFRNYRLCQHHSDSCDCH